MKHLKILATYLLDLALVVAFTAAGRSTHHEDVLGSWGTKLWTTAWPFALALTIGWVAFRAWKTPTSMRTGAALWLATIALGLTLRALTGGGLAIPFVLVATGVVGALLLGWRAIALVVTTVRRPK